MNSIWHFLMYYIYKMSGRSVSVYIVIILVSTMIRKIVYIPQPYESFYHLAFPEHVLHWSHSEMRCSSRKNAPEWTLRNDLNFCLKLKAAPFRIIHTSLPFKFIQLFTLYQNKEVYFPNRVAPVLLKFLQLNCLVHDTRMNLIPKPTHSGFTEIPVYNCLQIISMSSS